MEYSTKIMSLAALYAACGVTGELSVTPNYTGSSGSGSEASVGGNNSVGSGGMNQGGNYTGGLAGFGGSAGSGLNGGFGGNYDGGFGGAGEGGSLEGGMGGNDNAGGASGYNGAAGNGGEAGNGGAGGMCSEELLGKFATYSQGGWHNSATSLISAILSSGDVVIGDKNTDYAVFTTSNAVINFLPAGGTPGALQGQYTNPTTTPAGVLAGQTLTLKLNLAISNAVCGYKLHDLIITQGICKDKTVSEIQDLADQALAGTSVSLSYSDLNKCVEGINLNFNKGLVDNQYLKLP